MDKNQYSVFCLQCGKEFPEEKHKGILFVGRSVNGWINNEIGEVDLLFGDKESYEKTCKPIFDVHDQMEWIENLEGNKKGYNTLRSPFWRVVKRVASYYYPNSWFNYVAWSNLYKVSPSEQGNPGDFICGWQFINCCRILHKEIELLSPKIVLFLTGMEWADSFLKYLNKGELPTVKCSLVWGEKYKADLIKIGDIYFIVTEYPQGKNENEHVDVLQKLIFYSNSLYKN